MNDESKGPISNLSMQEERMAGLGSMMTEIEKKWLAEINDLRERLAVLQDIDRLHAEGEKENQRLRKQLDEAEAKIAELKNAGWPLYHNTEEKYGGFGEKEREAWKKAADSKIAEKCEEFLRGKDSYLHIRNDVCLVQKSYLEELKNAMPPELWKKLVEALENAHKAFEKNWELSSTLEQMGKTLADVATWRKGVEGES